EAIRVGGTPVRLERYVVDGVVWGRETIWLDERGAIAAAITRAGGLGFEAVREDLEPALVAFVQRATRDRIGDLEALTKRMPLLKSGTYAVAGATIVDGTGRAPIADGVVVVRDGRIADVGPDAFGVVYAASADEAKQAVAKYHDAGFQQMKIYSLVTPPVVEAICAEAHRLGMSVTGHVPSGMTIEQAAAAGMDQIAHLPIRGDAGSDEVKRTVAFLRDHKTVIDPTQSWNELLGHAAGTPIAAFQPGVAKI